MSAEGWKAEIDKVLLKYGVTKETMQENAAEELASSLQDYHDLAQQYSDMMTHYCYEDKPVRRSGVWCCPKCGKRIQYNHSFCHWCGKKVGWKQCSRI